MYGPGPGSAEPGKNSVEHEPSRTALGTAALRALAAADEKVRGPDSLAELFVTEDVRRALKIPAAARSLFLSHITPGMYEYLIARTAFFDALVERALREGAPQIVFLGAGYDTRPHRFRDLIGPARIFELDARPTQQRKTDILKSSGIPIPPGLVHVPVNFNSDDFLEKLSSAGFDKRREAVFVWEGVSYYLPAEAVDATLRLIGSCLPGSSVAFDYACLSPENLQDEKVRHMREMHRTRYEGEPVRFGIRSPGIREFLGKRGFEIREHLTAEEMQSKYVSRPGAPSEKIPALFCLVEARVC
jgi:methyltransferase (TIGR00027 family)